MASCSMNQIGRCTFPVLPCTGQYSGGLETEKFMTLLVRVMDLWSFIARDLYFQ